MTRASLRILPVHLGFALDGVATTLLGPILPSLTSHFSLNDEQAGRFFMAQFAGAIAGSLASGRSYTTWGGGRTLFAGFAAIACGVAVAGRDSLALSFAGVCLYGVGIGLVTPAINLLAADESGGRRTANLNALNASWCAGAVAGPPLILRLLATHPLIQVLEGFTLALALLAAYFVFPPAVAGAGPAAKVGGGFHLQRIVVLTCCFLFLYVGMENGVNGWLVSFGLRAKGMQVTTVAYSHAMFWGAILAGRLLAAFWPAALSDARLIVGGILAALAGTVMFVVSSTGIFYFAGIFLAGLGMSVIFPTTISVFMGRGGVDAQRSAGLVFACASLGGAAIPWLIGRVSSWLLDLQTAMWILIACGVLMLALQVWMRAGDPMQERSQAS